MREIIIKKTIKKIKFKSNNKNNNYIYIYLKFSKVIKEQ